MVFQWSPVIFSALFYAMTNGMVQADQADSNNAVVTDDQKTRAAYEQALLGCLQSKITPENMNLKNADVQCALKYFWIQGKTTRVFDTKTENSNYKRAFGFEEPNLKKVSIDQSCDKIGSSSYFARDFDITKIVCLEYCQKQCAALETQPSDQYPVGKISCGFGSGKGCDEQRICQCTSRSGVSCGPATNLTFGEVLDTYTDTCLNCKNERYSNQKQPLNFCMRAMKNWINVKPTHSIMGLFADYLYVAKMRAGIKPRMSQTEKPKVSQVKKAEESEA